MKLTLNSKEEKMFKRYVSDRSLKQYHLKVLICLMSGPKTQLKLFEEISAPDKNSFYQVVRELRRKRFITEIKNSETRSTLYELQFDVNLLQINGQMTLF